MDRIAFVFPGQGTQRVGMGLDLARAHPGLMDTYYRPAEEILGLELSRLCWEGPAAALTDTSVTQPAVFVTSMCAAQVLRGHGLHPDLVAGHSLGEYAALVLADVLSWTDALRLVQLRGRLMAGVGERTPGTMAAVLGLTLAGVEAICARSATATGQVVEVANDNEPAQVVISGQVAAVQYAMGAAREAGARRVTPLDVGAPFHCSLMSEIEDEFAAALAAVTFREPARPLISSVTASEITSGSDARQALARQLTGRVQWTAAVTRMARPDAVRFVEVGPGRALGGLCRRIVPGAPVYATHDSRQCALTCAELLPRSTVTRKEETET